MDSNVQKDYQEQINKAVRCRDWFAMETTQEFLAPLKAKLSQLQEISIEDMGSMDNSTFRAHLEGNLLAAKEIKDYFGQIEGIIGAIEYAQKALAGQNIDTYGE